MFRGWLQLGQTEIANTARTVAYLRRGVRNATLEVTHDDSWADTATWLGHDPYVSPWEDLSCPWHDATIPASAEFAGVWVMDIRGAEATPVKRDVVESAIAGGAFGAVRTPPRELEIEALVLAGTPAGLEYGLTWLGAALRGDTCTDGTAPRQLLFLESPPPSDDLLTPENIAALGNAEARMMADVALTKPLRVEETFGRWVAGGSGATGARVQFELTAGVPWVWGLPRPLVSGLRPALGEPRTVRFENVGDDGECPSACPPDSRVLVDPLGPALATLPRPLSPAAAAGCSPLQSRRLVWHLEAGRTAVWMDTVPTVTVRTGGRDERHVRIQWAEGRISGDASMPCSTVGEALIGFIPAHSTLTLDAVTGGATVVTDAGERFDATPLVTGRAGGPWRPPVLRCAADYTLIIDAEQSVHRDVTVNVDAVQRRR